MPSNIEIKARVRDLQNLLSRAEKLTGSVAEILHQEDTFFSCPSGRLKLRRFSETSGELMFYRRADQAGTKQSDYLIARTTEPAALLEVLSAALGARQRVVKRRLLLLHGQTRIHLDEVQGLGTFMELEVVLRPGQDAGEGHAVARSLMHSLGIGEGDLIEGAYADLLAEN